MAFITKYLSKAITKGSKLRNNFLKIKYLANSNEKDIVDNKTFWKTIKPSFFCRSVFHT